MATATYTPLANITLGSSAASVTFSSISQAYRDLVLVISSPGSNGGATVNVQFNSDTTSSNYTFVQAYGDGSTAVSSSTTNYNWLIVNTSSVASMATMSVMDYSATDKNKSALIRVDRSDSATYMRAGRWANTAAITSMALVSNATFASGTTFALYGIAA